MRAELANLRDEFALFRQAQARTTTASDPQPTTIPATTIGQPLPLAAGVAPPSLANRLPIPSMPIGANHYHRAQAHGPLRPRTDTNNLVSYASPVSVYPYNHGAAALLGNSNSNHTNSGVPPVAGPVGAPPPMYPVMPSYYVPPRGNHLSNPYAVHPMPAPNVAYGQLPPNHNHEASLDALDPPGEVVANPSPWYTTATRPALSYPISHERPSASGSASALALPAPSATAMPYVGTFPSAAATPIATAFTVPPAAILGGAPLPPPVAPSFPQPTASIAPTSALQLYEQQRQVPVTPQYRVLLGQQPTPSASAQHPMVTSTPGMLWSVPRIGAPSSQGGNGVDLSHDNTGMLALSSLGGVREDLIPGSGDGNGLMLFGGGAGGSSRRSSVQNSLPVTDWQALIEDATARSPRVTPTRTPEETFGGGGAGSSSGGVESGLSSMMAPDAAGGGGSQP
ncbi:hypothetical protein JCM10908_004993 [Rhodotorula pacifica]|uniref:uncharacterized protein n=1 Tax=Rhodotorula pacifica TaxID=1495444 RepID=UPI0031717B68